MDTLVDDIKEMGKMEIPIQIVWGRHDVGGSNYATVKKMHEYLKGSKFEIFENSGHCPHEEESKEFNRIVIDFLSSK